MHIRNHRAVLKIRFASSIDTRTRVLETPPTFANIILDSEPRGDRLFSRCYRRSIVNTLGPLVVVNERTSTRERVGHNEQRRAARDERDARHADGRFTGVIARVSSTALVSFISPAKSRLTPV